MEAETKSDDDAEVTVALIGEWAALEGEADRVRVGGLVVDRYPSALRALRREARQQRPDWLLLGAGVPEDVLRRLSEAARAVVPSVKLAVLGPANDIEREEQWRPLGARVYLTSSASVAHLAAAILASSAEDLSVVDTCFERLKRQHQAESRAQLLNHLTRREVEGLRLMTGGLANAEIACRLSVSQNTVEAHVLHILLKLNATNRTEAVDHARRAGLL